jgi:hypothetical protein
MGMGQENGTDETDRTDRNMGLIHLGRSRVRYSHLSHARPLMQTPAAADVKTRPRFGTGAQRRAVPRLGTDYLKKSG